jgi:hypothetical protein
MRIEHDRLPDFNSADFGVVHYETEIFGSDKPADLVIFGNGYLENPQVLSRSVEALVQYAEQERTPMHVVLHDSPLTGKSAYGLDYRTARFDQVVRHYSHNGQVPVRLAGHSWGLPQAVMVGSPLLSEGGQLESVTGINPNGLTPIELTPRNLIRLAAGGIREIRMQAELMARFDATAVGIGRNAVMHIGGNLLAAAAEGHGLLTHDITEPTVRLHHSLLERHGEPRLPIIAGSNDSVCPSGPMRHNLIGAGFPVESFNVLRTGHGGVLIDPQYAPHLLRAIIPEPVQELRAS